MPAKQNGLIALLPMTERKRLTAQCEPVLLELNEVICEPGDTLQFVHFPVDAFISLLHDSGVRSHLTMSRAAGQTGPRFRVLGSESSYSVNGLDNQEPFLKEQRWPGSDGYGVTPEAEWGLIGVADALEPTPTERGAYPDFYAGVAASILEGAPSPVDPKDALEVVRIIERAHALSAAASV